MDICPSGKATLFEIFANCETNYMGSNAQAGKEMPGGSGEYMAEQLLLHR